MKEKEHKNDTKEQYRQLGEKILNLSRNELYLSMRFLDIALGSLLYKRNQNTFFVGTDGTYLYYNPRFLMERYQYHPVLVNRAYFHMILHAMFRHIWNRGEREEELWNISCDIVVESIIDGMDYDAIKRFIPEKRETLYRDLDQFQKVLTAEGVYHYLKTAPMGYQDLISIGTEFLVDDHSFWPKEQKEKEEASKASKKDKGEKQNQQKEDEDKNQEKKNRQQREQREVKRDQWKKITEQIKTDMETFRKQAGDVHKGLLQSLGVTIRKKQDYRSFLKRFAVLKEEMQIDPDSFDYGFYHFGMGFYGNMPLIEELEYRENLKIQQFVIAIDTSGSCSGETIKQFLNQTFSILKDTENFFCKTEIHMIQCDQEIQEDICIENQEQLEKYQKNFIVKGYGGTDFRPVFEYIEKLKQMKKLKQLKGILYFTDGYGIYPKKRPSYDTVFIFPADHYLDQEVPSWAMKFILEADKTDGSIDGE